MGAAGQGTAEAEAVAGRRATATESRSSDRRKDADEIKIIVSTLHSSFRANFDSTSVKASSSPPSSFPRELEWTREQHRHPGEGPEAD